MSTDKPTEDELRQQIRAELEAEFAAREEARLRLLSLTAHELATPTSTIKGYVQILDEGMAGELDAEQQKVVAAALRNVQRMERIVRDLSDFAKLETEELDVFPAPVLLDEILSETVGVLLEQMRENGVEVEMAVSDDLPLVYADRMRVTQIVTNLLSNAIKYTPEGGQVTVQAEVAGESVQVMIKDTGIGIAEDELPKLFQPFFRSKDPWVRGKTGTGLGLVLVDNLVRLQKGTLSLESEKDVGTTVTFALPLYTPAG